MSLAGKDVRVPSRNSTDEPRLLHRLWSTRKAWFVAGLTVVLAGGGAGIWAASSGGAAAAETQTTETVSTTTIRQTVSASGTLASASEADLSSPLQGR